MAIFYNFIGITQCDNVNAEGLLPAECEIIGTESSRMFINTACDLGFCQNELGVCDGSSGIPCCCQDNDLTSYSFTCPASEPRTIFQPATCSCQPCGDLTVTLIFVITSGSNGSAILGAEVVINNEPSPLITVIILV